MYKTFLRRCLAASIVVWGLSAVSCVNEEYDLSKEIDLEMTILRNTSVPIGHTGMVGLDEFLSLDESESIISKDSEGNLYFTFSQEIPEVQDFNIPEWTFHASQDANPVESQVPAFYIPIGTSSQYEEAWKLAESPVAVPQIEFDIVLDQEDIPTEIHDIKYATVVGELVATVKYRADQNKVKMIWLDEGASFEFPEWLILGDMPDGLYNDGTHVITENSLMIDTEDHPIHIPIIGIDFSKLPEGQGVVRPGKLHLDTHVKFNGNVHLDRNQVRGSGSFAPVFTASLSISEMDISSVEVLVMPEFELEPSSVKIEDVPEFLLGDDVCLDLAEFWLNMNITNTSPFAGKLTADIITQKGGIDIVDIPFGPVSIPAHSEVAYSFSETGSGAPEGYEDVQVDDMGLLLKTIPETITFDNLDMEFDEQYTLLTPGHAFEFVFSYDLLAPLAFGKNFRLEYSTDFSDMAIDLTDLQVKKATMSINAVSSMPFDILMDADAIDAEGNLLEDIEIIVEGSRKLSAGSIGNPSVSPVVLAISSDRPIAFDGLRLNVTASCNDTKYTGMSLNVNQGLEFRDIVLNLPEGITAEADELF